VDAATVLAERGGLAAVTTRRVAAELGAGSASLYRHLRNRVDLIDLMVDAAFERYEPPPVTGAWRSDLVAEHMHRLRYLRARPWLVEAIFQRPPLGPATQVVLEHLLALLADHPAPGQAKLEAIGVLTGMVQTYLLNERPGQGVLDPQFVQARTTMLVRAAHDGQHPHLAKVVAEVLGEASTAVGQPDDESADAQLIRVLGSVLDGLLPEH